MINKKTILRTKIAIFTRKKNKNKNPHQPKRLLGGMEAPAKKGLKGRMVDIKTVLEIGSICYRNGHFLEIISISRQ